MGHSRESVSLIVEYQDSIGERAPIDRFSNHRTSHYHISAPFLKLSRVSILMLTDRSHLKDNIFSRRNI